MFLTHVPVGLFSHKFISMLNILKQVTNRGKPNDFMARTTICYDLLCTHILKSFRCNENNVPNNENPMLSIVVE